MKISAKYICQHDSRNEIQMTILSTMMEYRHLQSELGAPPVSPLGVVPDGVAGPHSNNRTLDNMKSGQFWSVC